MKIERICIFFFIIIIFFFTEFEFFSTTFPESRIIKSLNPVSRLKSSEISLHHRSLCRYVTLLRYPLLCCSFRFRLNLCTSGFGLLPEMCRPVADTEVSCRTREKNLFPGTTPHKRLLTRPHSFHHIWKTDQTSGSISGSDSSWTDSTPRITVKSVLCETNKNWH